MGNIETVTELPDNPRDWPRIVSRDDAMPLYVKYIATRAELLDAKKKIRELERDLSLAGHNDKLAKKNAQLGRQLHEKQQENNLLRNIVREMYARMDAIVSDPDTLRRGEKLKQAARDLRAFAYNASELAERARARAAR